MYIVKAIRENTRGDTRVLWARTAQPYVVIKLWLELFDGPVYIHDCLSDIVTVATKTVRNIEITPEEVK